MIADLKKENFDLKLRLFHLEDAQREVWEKGGANDSVWFSKERDITGGIRLGVGNAYDALTIFTLLP